MKVLLIWDAGHKYHTAGKRTPFFPDGSQIREYEFNRPTVDKCIALSKKYGFETFDTSTENTDPGLVARANRANDAAREFLKRHPNGIVIFISIHYNAHKSEWEASNANGIEVFHNPGSVKGKSLAEHVLKELIKGTPMTNRGVKNVGFYLLKHTTMPAILAELGYMDHMPDALLMKSESYQQECAQEILDGIRKYLGIYKEEPKQIPEWEQLIRSKMSEPEAWINLINEFSKNPPANHPVARWLPQFVEKLGNN